LPVRVRVEGSARHPVPHANDVSPGILIDYRFIPHLCYRTNPGSITDTGVQLACVGDQNDRYGPLGAVAMNRSALCLHPGLCPVGRCLTKLRESRGKVPSGRPTADRAEKRDGQILDSHNRVRFRERLPPHASRDKRRRPFPMQYGSDLPVLSSELSGPSLIGNPTRIAIEWHRPAG
jgi:hypothetical protein